MKIISGNATCGGEIHIESKGYMKTPHFPSYPTNIECKWILNVPEGKSIYLKFDAFEVFTIYFRVSWPKFKRNRIFETIFLVHESTYRLSAEMSNRSVVL